MSYAPSSAPALWPRWRADPRVLLRGWVQIVAAVAVLSAASRTSVSFFGTVVPFTLQPQAVVAVAAALGARRGTAAVAAWLTLAAWGAPVLALGAAGPAALVGPTAGYLWSYLPVAYGVGRFGRGTGPAAFAVWLAAGGFTLASGTAVLAAWVGWRPALAFGLTPFLAGDACKLVAAFVARVLVRGATGASGGARRHR